MLTVGMKTQAVPAAFLIRLRISEPRFGPGLRWYARHQLAARVVAALDTAGALPYRDFHPGTNGA